MSLVDRVVIHAGKAVDVQLLYRDQFAAIAEFLRERAAQGGQTPSGRAE